MKNTLFKLALSVKDKSNKKYIAHFYRHRGLLKKKCAEICAFQFLESGSHIQLLQTLSRYGPLLPRDFDDKASQQILKKWKLSFPDDPKFFSMVSKQREIWAQYKEKTLLEFFESKDGLAWLEKRKKIGRVATFELDQSFKRTKSKALREEIKIRRIMRIYPHLSLSDLKKLKVKNAQFVIERFPFRLKYQSLSLKRISLQLSNS